MSEEGSLAKAKYSGDAPGCTALEPDDRNVAGTVSPSRYLISSARSVEDHQCRVWEISYSHEDLSACSLDNYT